MVDSQNVLKKLRLRMGFLLLKLVERLNDLEGWAHYHHTKVLRAVFRSFLILLVPLPFLPLAALECLLSM